MQALTTYLVFLNEVFTVPSSKLVLKAYLLYLLHLLCDLASQLLIYSFSEFFHLRFSQWESVLDVTKNLLCEFTHRL